MKGLLKHRKALLINTALGSEVDYKFSGIEDAMRKIIVDECIKFSGIQNVEYIFFYSVGNTDAETMKRYLGIAYRLGKEF